MPFHPVPPFASQRTLRTKVLLVLDVVESVRLMEQDEQDVVARWQHFVGHVVRDVLPAHAGRMVKSLGDGLMLEFEAPRDVLKAAFAILAHSREINAALPAARKMQLRLASHIAGFFSDEHDIYGADVNLAVRLTSITKPGELVVSAELRERLVQGVDADFEDLGECFLKHISKPARAYRVRPAEPHTPIVEYDRASATLRPAIAVLPFNMRSSSPQHSLLGEALADELISALSRTAELRVISRLSTSMLRDREDPVREIQTHLGANYLLAGTCREIDGKLVVFAELIDAKSNHVVWAEHWRCDLRSVFSESSEVVAQLVSAVCSAVMKHQLDRVRSSTLPTLESYALLLGAITLMHRLSREDFERSRQMLDALVERVPREPIPRAWLARWHTLRLSQGWSTDPKHDALIAFDCSQRALDADPDCALALTIDGMVHTYLLQNHEVAHTRYSQALEVNPNEPFAWLHRGTLYAFKGAGEPAMKETEMALSLSPLDPLRYYFDSLAATAAASAGRYERAIELARRSLRANRSHTSTLRALAVAQVQLNQVDAARESVKLMLKLEPGFTVHQFRARSPTSQYAFGELCARSLQEAGAPI